MKILLTGAAGFIGYHTARALMARGDQVVGIDSLNDYYDVRLKHARLNALEQAARTANGTFEFRHGDMADREFLSTLFADGRYDRIIHLAAQAGVRYSLENPHAYVESNVVGFVNLLEACRGGMTDHLVFASTSSVYGANTAIPFKEGEAADHPLQFYAATKRSNELMAHAYAHLFDMPVTGLRFFTVYGPWGRPDMAPWLFTSAILEGRSIDVFNHGDHQRDFTYVDDIAEGVVRASDVIATPDPAWNSDAPDPGTSSAPFRIYNIGNSEPVRLMDFIEAIEHATGREAVKNFLPKQPGDVHTTYADVSRLREATGYAPSTPMQEGVARFVAWYRDYHGV